MRNYIIINFKTVSNNESVTLKINILNYLIEQDFNYSTYIIKLKIHNQKEEKQIFFVIK